MNQIEFMFFDMTIVYEILRYLTMTPCNELLLSKNHLKILKFSSMQLIEYLHLKSHLKNIEVFLKGKSRHDIEPKVASKPIVGK